MHRRLVCYGICDRGSLTLHGIAHFVELGAGFARGAPEATHGVWVRGTVCGTANCTDERAILPEVDAYGAANVVALHRIARVPSSYLHRKLHLHSPSLDVHFDRDQDGSFDRVKDEIDGSANLQVAGFDIQSSLERADEPHAERHARIFISAKLKPFDRDLKIRDGERFNLEFFECSIGEERREAGQRLAVHLHIYSNVLYLNISHVDLHFSARTNRVSCLARIQKVE
mmetsp:Transcript_12188/g.19691  ORF Transcript_12188/g.19691 Transcript_12188/m.19691 type:complete len:228 (+) Transcript_12188:231-914(+)